MSLGAPVAIPPRLRAKVRRYLRATRRAAEAAREFAAIQRAYPWDANHPGLRRCEEERLTPALAAMDEVERKLIALMAAEGIRAVRAGTRLLVRVPPSPTDPMGRSGLVIVRGDRIVTV